MPLWFYTNFDAFKIDPSRLVFSGFPVYALALRLSETTADESIGPKVTVCSVH